MSHPDDTPLPDDLVVPDDLSSLLDGAIGTTDLPSQIGDSGVVAVIAAPGPGAAAPYITEVQPTDDLSISLPYDRAVAYGMAVLAAAHRSHYLAAVLAQARDILAGRGAQPEPRDAEELDATARMVVASLIDDLPDLDEAATAPLRFTPCVRRPDGRPLVRLSVPPHTEAITWWTFSEACHHATSVLDQAVVSQLDTVYRNVMAVTFDAGEMRGRAAVQDLGNYFWEKPEAYAEPDTEPEARLRKAMGFTGRPEQRKARPTGKGKKRKR